LLIFASVLESAYIGTIFILYTHTNKKPLLYKVYTKHYSGHGASKINEFGNVSSRQLNRLKRVRIGLGMKLYVLCAQNSLDASQ
jgi:hypothetical protein